jgi:ATP-dependent RNA helicase DeaD
MYIDHDVPFDAESYLHRIGRTGRAGRPGTPILFVTPRETRLLKTIERFTGPRITPMRASRSSTSRPSTSTA